MTATIDVIFCTHDRMEFTRFSWAMLLANTSWDRVRTLHVYDDCSTDGTRQMMRELVKDANLSEVHVGGCSVELHEVHFESSVGALNAYVAGSDSDRVCKIDSDIIVPPGWLVALSDTMDAHPDVDLLGMEGGRIEVPPEGFTGPYTIEPARWIGGIGMMKTATLGAHGQINQNGRYFGFTEWQREYGSVVKAWIKPDLLICELSRIPFEPWRSISDRYREAGVERPWPRYHERWSAPYWEWWPADHAQYARKPKIRKGRR